MNNISVKTTTDISIFIQIVTLITSFLGLRYKLPKEHQIINRLLIMETSVQIIELSFYILFLNKMSETVTGMAKTRYYDWVITTPTMLLTTIIYFDYINRIENKLNPISFIDFIKNNMKNIQIIFIANFFMLLCGFLYETGKLSKDKAVIIGFIFFLISFGTIYNEYAKYTDFGRKLFYTLFIIWGSYGIAFLFNDVAKNNSINFLDLFAKNFFGIYLFFVARKHAI